MQDPKQHRVNGVSVVIPVFCSARLLEHLYARLAKTLDQLTHTWEIILVDHASTDHSWAVACQLREQDPRVRIVRLAHNHGQAFATFCGLGYATQEYVVTIDDDLQCSPEDLPHFIQALQRGYGLVIGQIAPQHKKHPWWRNWGSRLYQYVARILLNHPKGLSF